MIIFYYKLLKRLRGQCTRQLPKYQSVGFNSQLHVTVIKMYCTKKCRETADDKRFNNQEVKSYLKQVFV